MGIRHIYNSDMLYTMSGIAIRLARKMGLHQDGLLLDLSSFETEIRRRLWWHLVCVDFKASDLLGVQPSLDISLGNTKLPLNVEDEDLHPDMLNFPTERTAITSVTMCLIRWEIMEALRRASAGYPSDIRWEILCHSDTSPLKKDKMINEIEDVLEQKYLRYCDPINELHSFISIMCRASICRMRIYAYNPRQYRSSAVKLTRKEHDVVFENVKKMLEYAAAMQRNVGKFLWQAGSGYIWDTLLYILIEVRHRKTGPEIDQTWSLIGEIFAGRPKIFHESSGPVYKAMRKWTIEVWNSYVAASREAGRTRLSTPEYIDEIRRTQTDSSEHAETFNSSAFPFTSAAQSSSAYGDLQNSQSSGSQPVPNFSPFEADANDWVVWQQMVAEENGFFVG
jgi:hypothetical protein